MAYFSVVVNGEGISVPSSTTGEEIIGFYTTRWIKAASADEAKSVAIDLVMSDWTEGEYAESNRGESPRLSVDSISQVSLIKYLWRQPGSGHTFYTSE